MSEPAAVHVFDEARHADEHLTGLNSDHRPVGSPMKKSRLCFRRLQLLDHKIDHSSQPCALSLKITEPVTDGSTVKLLATHLKEFGHSKKEIRELLTSSMDKILDFIEIGHEKSPACAVNFSPCLGRKHTKQRRKEIQSNIQITTSISSRHGTESSK